MQDNFSEAIKGLVRVDPDSILIGENFGTPNQIRQPVNSFCPSSPARHFKISEALGPESYAMVAEKVLRLKVPNYWCASGDCACMGCANQFLNWAEFECWRKYGPFNRLQDESEGSKKDMTD